MGISILYALWIFFGINNAASQGDSLRSALSAVDKRQRFYSLENAPVSYSRENPADLSYLSDSVSLGGNDIDEYSFDGDDDLKQITSSFRERLEEEEKERQLEEISQHVIANLLSDDVYENLYDYHPKNYNMRNKYQTASYPRNDRNSPRTRKRQFYPEFGYDSIGLRKRDKYAPSDYTNGENYLLNMNDDYGNDYVDNSDVYARRSLPYRDLQERYISRARQDGFSNFRHIPVTKRSSDYPNIYNKDEKQKKKLTKTDPKIEKDLSSVFNGSNNKTKKNTKELNKKKAKDEKSSHVQKPDVIRNGTKKEFGEVVPSLAKEKPIAIAKKSIAWSDYFGLDRRKKNKDEITTQWIMDRYHKAISAVKKNSEYSLQNLHENDNTKTTGSNDKNESEDSKLDSMDKKLKTIEDDIVDDALKYTGANEGVTDPKDIEEVKDGIISRLTEAYIIDKMRKALDEYRTLVDKEREKLKKKEEEAIEPPNEEKRVSVPRKQAVDPNEDSSQIEDNHIKCTQGNADCNEENYKTPIEVIEQINYEVGGCPTIQRDCSQVAPLLGKYSKIFEEACATHQMCLLCGNNSWYPATRKCNILFLSKVFDKCAGKTDCQKELQKSLRYLMNINRNLRNDSSGECNLVCPDGLDGVM